MYIHVLIDTHRANKLNCENKTFRTRHSHLITVFDLISAMHAYKIMKGKSPI